MSWYSEVFENVFPNLDKKRANSLWKSQIKKSQGKDKKKDKGDKYDSDDKEDNHKERDDRD